MIELLRTDITIQGWLIASVTCAVLALIISAYSLGRLDGRK